MRVVHVIDNLGPGGNERQCVELLRGLAAQGDVENLLVVLSRGVFYGDLASLPNLRVVHVVRRFRRDVSIVARLYRLCRMFAPDVVVAYESMSAVGAGLVARLLGAPFVNAMVQDAPPGLSRKLRMRRWVSFALAAAIVANSEAGLRAYRVPAGRGRVIRNGFAGARLSALRDAGAVRTEAGFRGPLVVGMVASFSPRKDQPTFIRAAEAILARRTDTTFAMIGDGPRLEACRHMVVPAHRAAIRFLGRRSDVESIVNVLDVGVLATFTEGIPNAIMEYMALGKPVVATRGGGTPELVLDGETGFLTAEGDAGELARRIDQLLDDPLLRQRMGQAGRVRIAREFSLERMTAAHRQVYEEVTGRPAPGTARPRRMG